MITSNYVRERRQALELGEHNYALSDDRPCCGAFAAEPFVRGQSQTFYCGVRELSDRFIVAGFLIVDPGNCVTDGQALADLVMRPQTLQQRIPPVLCF